MKKVKRIISFALLIVVIALIGYLVYTGNRLTDYPEDLGELKGKTFVSGSRSLSFIGKNLWYDAEERIMLLEIVEYEKGVLKTERNGATYVFEIIDSETVYDYQTQEILVRSGSYG